MYTCESQESNALLLLAIHPIVKDISVHRAGESPRDCTPSRPHIRPQGTVPPHDHIFALLTWRMMPAPRHEYSINDRCRSSAATAGSRDNLMHMAKANEVSNHNGILL